MPAYERGDRPTILSKQFRMTFGIGLVVILIAVGAILYIQRGAHIELKGAVLKVRTLAMDENSMDDKKHTEIPVSRAQTRRLRELFKL